MPPANPRTRPRTTIRMAGCGKRREVTAASRNCPAQVQGRLSKIADGGERMRRDQVHEIVTLGMTGRLSRREVIARLALLGLSSSAIASALAGAGLQPARAAAPGRRGESGVLKVLYWQAPTIVNPHLSTGTKDYHASHLCTEPLLTLDAAGVFTPVLAAEVPSRANGGVSADGRSVTYKLKQGVKWADGQPFTADDVVFTYQFVANKETGAITLNTYIDVEKVEALGPYAVKITFKTPTPAWFVPFVGENGQIIPRHALEAYIGPNARNAPSGRNGSQLSNATLCEPPPMSASSATIKMTGGPARLA